MTEHPEILTHPTGESPYLLVRRNNQIWVHKQQYLPRVTPRGDTIPTWCDDGDPFIIAAEHAAKLGKTLSAIQP